VGDEEVIRPEVHRLIEGEFSLLDLMEDGQDDRQLEDRLHGRVRLRIQIALER
jgi:hypothetical protein